MAWSQANSHVISSSLDSHQHKYFKTARNLLRTLGEVWWLETKCACSKNVPLISFFIEAKNNLGIILPRGREEEEKKKSQAPIFACDSIIKMSRFSWNLTHILRCKQPKAKMLILQQLRHTLRCYSVRSQKKMAWCVKAVQIHVVQIQG